MGDDEENRELSDEKKTILTTMYIFGAVLFTLNLAFSIHNIIAYLVRKKVGSSGVYVFYALVVIQSVIHLVYFSMLAKYPDYDPVLLFDGENRWFIADVFESIG